MGNIIGSLFAILFFGFFAKVSYESHLHADSVGYKMSKFEYKGFLFCMAIAFIYLIVNIMIYTNK
jgi:hypothetical protein